MGVIFFMKTFLTATLMTASLALTGCASIMSGSTQTLTFKSVPDTANIVITNKLGEKIHTGSTPATVTLKRGNGYFKPASYDVTFSKEGYQHKTVHVTAKMNGWYIANIVFGGFDFINIYNICGCFCYLFKYFKYMKYATPIIITNGIGTSSLPIRTGAPAEIVIITLHSSNKTK